MEKLTAGMKRAAFLTGLDQLMNKTCLILAGTSLILLILVHLSGWILPSATTQFLVPALAIISIVAVFLFNHAGLIVALLANFTALALLYNRWSATGEEAIAVIIAMLIYSTLGCMIIFFFKGKEETHRQNLEWMSTIDCLTETYNHRYFQQRLNEEIARSKRNGNPVALLFIDLDNFKAYNDQNGHVLGDRMLRKTADFLKKGVRIHDVVCRYGGDEFVIILPDTDENKAGLLARRLVNYYARQKMSGKPGSKARVTLSIGASSYPGQSRNLAELIQHADHALYLAKEAGKNKTRIYGKSYRESNSATETIHGSFCYNAFKHALISNYRTLMETTPKQTSAGASFTEDPSNGSSNIELKPEQKVIIGRALSLGHNGVKENQQAEENTVNLKVRVH